MELYKVNGRDFGLMQGLYDCYTQQIIIIIIIIIINCNFVITRWQWLFYMYTNME